MTALVSDAQLPPKIGVHPRPDGSFVARDAGPAPGRGHRRQRRPRRHEVGHRVPDEQRARACRPSTPSWSSTTPPPACRSPSSTAARSPPSAPRRSRASRSAASAPRGRQPAGPRGAHRRRRPGPQPRPGDRPCAAGRRSSPSTTATPSRAAALADAARDDGRDRLGPVAPDRREPPSTGADVVDHRGFVRRRPRQLDDQRLAGARRARRAGRLRDAIARPTWPRDAALFLVDQREQFLANRDAGPVRRLPGTRGDARRGDPGRARRDRPPGRVVVTPPGRRPCGRRVRGCDRAPGAGRGLGVELPR